MDTPPPSRHPLKQPAIQAREPALSRRERLRERLGLSLVVLGFMYPSALMFFILGWQDVDRAWRSKSWPSVPGEITQSYLRSLGKGSLAPEVRFTYTVRGRTYQGNWLYYGTHYSSEYTRSLVDRFPVHAQVPVYVDPQNPREAVLMPGPQPGTYHTVTIFGIILGLIPILLIVRWRLEKSPVPAIHPAPVSQG